jgi:TIR domain
VGVNNDLFWDHLLGHIEDQRLVPVVGPELTVINTDNGEQTFSSLIGQRLASIYQLDTSSEIRTMGEAVAEILHARGRDEVDLLYGQINRIIKEINPEPGDALRDLARIDDMGFFVSTTPDRLLAKALNDVRFRGRGLTRELTFSPNRSTSEQARNAQAAAPTDTVVLNLFGQVASTPEYVIHEEDKLEWLRALLPDAACLPGWVAHKLRHQPMLFVGCEIPDWIGRFLLRLSSTERLSDERKQFFFVGSSNAHVPSLSDFFSTYCRRSLVQQLEMEPTAFVSELCERCAKQDVATPQAAGSWVPDGSHGRLGSATASIFISYMHEDAEAARQLWTAITRLGGEVWLDERRMEAGDEWEKEVLTAIGETVRLFVPIISVKTEREREGYVFREWTEAIERARRISSGRFIVPVIIDEDYDGDLSRYPKGQKYFGRLNFGSAPAGEPDAGLTAMLTKEIDAINRPGAA